MRERDAGKASNVARSSSDFLDRRLASIARATSVQIGERSLSEVAREGVAAVASGFDCDAVVARLLEGESLALLASHGVPGTQLLRTVPANEGIARGMIDKRGPLLIDDVPVNDLTGEKYRVSPKAFRFRSFCGAPMLVGDRVVGILGLYCVERTHAFSDPDARDLQIVANHIAASIANAQLYERLTKLNAELEQRVAERTAALTQSEADLGLLAEHAIDIISRHHLDGRFAYVSPAVTRELGWDPEDLIGRLPREFVHPDDRDAVISARAEMMSARGRAVRREYRFRTRAGGYRWVESASRRIESAGQSLVVVTRDITARRDAEQRLRLVQTAVNEVRESVVITDAMIDRPGPRILYVNPAFTAMTGYTASEIEGKSPRVLQGELTDKKMLARLRGCLERGEPFAAETTNYRKDGTPYRVEWNIAPVHQADGQLTNWVSVQRDISGRHRAEQLARLHRDQLAHATRLTTMGELASGLAHELNQPLAAIANYASGGLNRIASPRPNGGHAEATADHADAESEALRQAGEALGRIRDQAERAGAIIRRLRGFVNRRTAQRRDVDLNDLVNEVVALNDADDRSQSVRIDLDLCEGLPSCRLDVIQIEQVILNLLRNALDAVEEQPAERRWIRLETGMARASGHPEPGVSEPSPEVWLEVSDAGHGLDEEQMIKLFDPFFTTKPEGMGLGLTISQSIVESHQGRLKASPNPSGGLTVTMRLPIVPA